MDEREHGIERLRQSIEDAKRLKAELEQRIADLNKRIKESKSLKGKSRKSKGFKPNSWGH
jgi:F0F1-type ATP synthase membrane subunit b/b'